MSAFYASILTTSGKEVTSARPVSVHLRKHNFGVEVTTAVNADIVHEFRVYATAGSNGTASPVLLGTVTYVEGTGPTFTPAFTRTIQCTHPDCIDPTDGHISHGDH